MFSRIADFYIINGLSINSENKFSSIQYSGKYKYRMTFLYDYGVEVLKDANGTYFMGSSENLSYNL